MEDDEVNAGELAAIAPGEPVTEAGQFRDEVCCAGLAVPGVGGGWWALGTSARGLDLPAQLIAELRLAAGDLSVAAR